MGRRETPKGHGSQRSGVGKEEGADICQPRYLTSHLMNWINELTRMACCPILAKAELLALDSIRLGNKGGL